MRSYGAFSALLPAGVGFFLGTAGGKDTPPFRWREVLLVAWLAAACWGPEARARTFYVDFETGSDLRDGLSMGQAWKHAPGDGDAQGVARGALLRGGDDVVFKGGVDYRGKITASASGDPDRPIRYLGAEWGPGRATISGYDRIQSSVETCLENSACPEDFRSAAFATIALPTKVTFENKLLVKGRAMTLAQSSALPNAVGVWDNGDTFFRLPRGQVEQNGETVTIASPELRNELKLSPGYDVTAFVWGYPNIIFYPSDANYDSDHAILKLNLPGFKLWNGLDLSFAIANHPRLLATNGQYVTIDRGRRLLMRSGSAQGNVDVDISRRSFGFNFGGQSNIEVDGFNFRGIVGGVGVIHGGAALLNASKSSNLKVINNNLAETTSFARWAAIDLNFVDGLVVKHNILANILIGRGIGLYKSNNVVLEDNSISHLTMTGILSIGCHDVDIKRNILSDINGVHGNGISIYLDNKNIEIANNTIVDSARPITYKGDNSGASIKLTIEKNLIWRRSEPGSNGAIQSWGARARDVAILSNVLIADKGSGVELRKGDTGIVIDNNVVDGVNAAGAAANDVTVQENLFLRDGGRFASADGNVMAADQGDAAKALFSDNPKAASAPKAPSAAVPNKTSVLCARLNGFKEKAIWGVDRRVDAANGAIGAGLACANAH